MPTWTPWEPWETNDLVTADMMNQQVLGNIEWLKSRPYQAKRVTGGYSTTSGSFVDIDATNLSVEITPIGTVVVVSFYGSVSHSASGGKVYIDLLKDGVSIGNSDGEVVVITAAANQQIPVFFSRVITGLTPETLYTFKLQWKASSGTAYLSGTSVGTHYRTAAQLWVEEYQ